MKKNLTLMRRSNYLFKMALTMESARESSAWSSLCSSVRVAAKCARLAAALASLSAFSLPYTPTCAGTCLNLARILSCAKAVSARRITCHRSVFSSLCPILVHPSASHRSIHLLMPSTQSRLSLKTTRHSNSVGQAIALRTARMMAVSSARFTVCLPWGMALTLKLDCSPNQTPQPAPQRPYTRN